jgi:UDP-N-acetylglucosamine--N-acetylmuramyl-(pentapeptide) pyrophosphoryl-undecaprenol N-acetylglucosamine transferase
MRTINILITGGGSSGHVSPALATARALRDLAAREGAGWAPRFLYVGSATGIERRQAEGAGLPFAAVATGKLRRYLSAQNLADALRVPLGAAQSLAVVARFRPRVVLSTGGYVCVPPVLAAAALRAPILCHEQTVQIGLANRIAMRFAARIALAWPAAAAELPPAQRSRAIVTGNPVRPEVFGGDPAQAAALAGFSAEDSALPTVYVTGGSQGARVINRAVEAAMPELLRHCRIIHQCGEQPAGDEQDYDRLQSAAAALPSELSRRYYATRFVGGEIGHVFALADLVLSRAGAGTLAELCALGKPAVYVPLVPTGGDEQTRNARMCVEAGAAALVPQAELDGPRLLAELPPLLADPGRRAAMGRAALALARPNAAHDLAVALLELAEVSL